MTALRDLVGQKFGRLTVVEIAGRSPNKNVRWKCSCDCGGSVVVASSNLVRGITRSCGCLKVERGREANTKHGLHGTGAHTSWMAMRQRCLNSNNRAYKSYGGRGITICHEWDSFDKFFADMGPRPDGMELDRIDVNGNYEPGNCRWATTLQQGRNQRKTRLVTINGITKPLTEWAQQYGINSKTVESRLHSGWSAEEALSVPKMRNGGRPSKGAKR